MCLLFIGDLVVYSLLNSLAGMQSIFSCIDKISIDSSVASTFLVYCANTILTCLYYMCYAYVAQIPYLVKLAPKAPEIDQDVGVILRISYYATVVGKIHGIYVR